MIDTLTNNVVRMGELFAEVATADPLSAALIAVGNVLILASVAVMGYLTAGAALDLVTRET